VTSRGNSFIEYALLCAIIVGGCALAISELQTSVESKLRDISAELKPG
jgi:Flp pilus assembly pilin Flp